MESGISLQILHYKSVLSKQFLQFLQEYFLGVFHNGVYANRLTCYVVREQMPQFDQILLCGQ